MEEYPNNYRTPRRRPSLLSFFAIAMLGAIIGGIIVSYYFYQKFEDNIGTPGQNQILGQHQIVYPQGEDITIVEAVADKVMPAVVGIHTIEITSDFFMRPIESEGVGTGVIISRDGIILTNHHVITDNPRQITVQLKDGRELKAEKLWSNANMDLGVIKIDANNLPIAELGDSDNIKVGQIAVAIGNPLGLRFERTVTSGIISALNRSIMISQNNIAEDLIQTDASINPGNSGGPLLNNKGEVIGINTYKIQTGEGLGFAIPINVARPIVNQIIEYGEFRPSVLGIQGLDREMASYFSEDIKIEKGILIIEIDSKSSSYQAGLRNNDVITHIDGKEVNTMIQLRTALYNHLPGDTVNITYNRANTQMEIEVVLQEGSL
jgi:serine protease Do